MDIRERIRREVNPSPRMVWNGVSLTFVQDVTVSEIDGVIARLEKLKDRLRPADSGLIVMDAGTGRIIKSEPV